MPCKCSARLSYSPMRGRHVIRSPVGWANSYFGSGGVRSRRLPLQSRSITPQPLEAVEISRWWLEDVNDHVTEVDEHPLSIFTPFDPQCPPITFLGSGLDLLGKRQHLPTGSTRSDHEHLADLQQIADVEQADVRSLLLIEDVGYQRSEFMGFQEGSQPPARSEPTMIVRSTTPLGWSVFKKTAPVPRSL